MPKQTLSPIAPTRLISQTFAKIQTETLNDVNVVEFSSANVGNLSVAVIGRQLASNTGLNNQVLADYKAFIAEWYEDLIPALRNSLERRRDQDLTWDPFTVVKSKPWPTSKKSKYIEQIIREMEGRSNPNKFYFTCFVKSGEQYEILGDIDQMVDEDGFYTGSERTRLIMPSSIHLVGLFCILQNLFFDSLKECIPGFIQAVKTEDLEEQMNAAIFEGLVTTISTDGSGFDSTQHAELMETVEDPIFNVLMDHADWVLKNAQAFRLMEQADIETLSSNIRKAYLRHNYEVIYPAPGAQIDHVELTRRQKDALDHSKADIDDVMILTLNGTTASGHPLTTLGNTLRQHSYALFDLWTAGYRKPWGSELGPCRECRVFTSGDDCVRFVRPGDAQRLSAIIKQHAAVSGRELDNGLPKGLGQVIKMVEVKPWHELDFLSKTPHNVNGQLVLTRDYRKRLLRGYAYSGINSELLRYPVLHQEAQLIALKLEKASRLLEEITDPRTTRPDLVLEGIEDFIQNTDLVRYAMARDDGYLAEESVNEHTQVTVSTLYKLITDKTVQVAFGTVEEPKGVKQTSYF